MFARPIRKKRGHGSNFTSSIGDNSSNSGMSEVDVRDRQELITTSINRDVLAPLQNSQQRILRRASSNTSLRPPITSFTPDGLVTTLSPQIHINLGQRRSISGNYTPPKNNKYKTTSQQPNKFPPPSFPQNLAHMRSNKSSLASYAQNQNSSEELNKILNRVHATPECLATSLQELRLHILKFGIPLEDTSMEYPQSNSLRCRTWKALLGVYSFSAGEYLHYIAKGASPMFDKVKNDTFRTLATDKKFLERVQEVMLVRVLNAIVWKAQADAPLGTIPTRFDYVQGMNVLVAPFLFVMPEVDAFFSSNVLLKNYCPTYVKPTLIGVHCGLKLMDKCLEVLDAELYFYLKSKGLTAEIYAFASILTLSACTPPLDELLKLWDFFFAFGIHLNVICTISQLMLTRNQLLMSPSPIKLLRTFPDLQAYPVIQLTRHLVKQLSAPLYEELATHPFDEAVCERYINGPNTSNFSSPLPNTSSFMSSSRDSHLSPNTPGSMSSHSVRSRS
ncbi:TBC-domain-containing protein [Neoconidiobolus thromboides FSU 785]|nr:TBC-domain-containing protein [Neoconidiobolus thromboides FSU 785]